MAGNLSELELTRGEITAAVTAGEQSVAYADRSTDVFQQMNKRTTQADALHQAGRRDESWRLFEDAEARQASDQPKYPHLYALRGFRYCDLLLTDSERATWHRRLNDETGPDEVLTRCIAECDAVGNRATYALQLAEKAGQLISIGLDHLTLARATLYKAVLASSRKWHSAVDHVTAAVNGLRAASIAEFLSRGLLTRAWLRCLSGDKPGSRADLDEAWEIAERGPMPLFQADIQLTRARLFRDRAALEEARRLIEKHGYHRRDGELADALEAARGWDLTLGRPPSRPHPLDPPLPSPTLPPGEGEAAAAARDQVFISYSHADEKFMKELREHLTPYSRSGSITAWSDQQIVPGSKWFDEIQAALGKTSVAVLLVSPGFLASDFIHDHELGPLLKKAEEGGVKILWVLVRACSYEETPLKDYQAVVSPPEKPLARIADRDDAWVRVCKEIKRAVNPIVAPVPTVLP